MERPDGQLALKWLAGMLCANDICILARSSQEMEGALAELMEICQEYGIRVSERKSEVVAMGRANGEENGVLMG